MVSVLIYYTNQCDKKKCTSIKIRDSMEKLNFKLVWSERPSKIRKNSIVLTPNSNTYLTSQDRDLIDKLGITILDCSWKQGDKYLKDWAFQNGRLLPPLVAGNPVNYGKWHTLTSLEALAASFYLVDLENECNSLLSLYNWGKTFYDLNKELLHNYRKCSSKVEILSVYETFITNHSKESS